MTVRIRGWWVSAFALVAGVACEARVSAPTDGVQTKFVVVSAGFYHACALTSDGAAYCWGARGGPLLGDGVTNDLGISADPVRVQSAATLTSISAGQLHSCATAATGAGYCWGRNSNGQLGNGTTTDRPVPTAVGGALVFRRIAAGGPTTSCGVSTANAAYCWGTNAFGALGIGSSASTDSTLVPVKTASALDFADIGVGASDVCALTTGGLAYCWGYNAYGQLGDGTLVDRNAPVPVSGGFQFRALSVGFDGACGLIADSTARCWGRNASGELGIGVAGGRTVPTAMVGGLHFRAIALRSRHSCGLVADGTAYCWGENNDGQLGDGTLTSSTSPVRVSGAVRFTSISVGNAFTCAVSTAGTVYCWGSNQSGQLGDGTTTSRNKPTPIISPTT